MRSLLADQLLPIAGLGGDSAGQPAGHALLRCTMRLLFAAGAYGSPALAATLQVSAVVYALVRRSGYPAAKIAAPAG